jgi:uncharacterized protein (TIGR00297 family)
MNLTRIALGLLLASLIGVLAYRRGSLSRSGVLGAILLGATIFGLGGWEWGILLVVFFVSSSALSHYKETLKKSLAEKFSKGSRRDLAQTLANGGAGALFAAAHFLWPSPVWWVAFVGALATVNADTWATELGVLSRDKPKLITTGREVEVGASGGVTVTGSQAALGGAALIGLLAGVFHFVMSRDIGQAVALANIAAIVGVGGSLVDSALGATRQAMYSCDHCGRETERHPMHICGHPTRYLRGWRWLDNDWVNFLSSVAGAALTAVFWSLAI